MENLKPTLLAVLAHPDDESFGMGGTLAVYAKDGASVHLICATQGEVGEVDPEYLQGYNSIAERRKAELECAGKSLGLASIRFLGYRDSGMTGAADNSHPQALINAPMDEIVEKIVTVMREIRPQVVLTFDPIGGYKHPDHIAIHQATVKAFNLAGDPNYSHELPPYQPAKLYFHIIPKGLLRVGVNLLRLFGKDPRHFGRNHDIDLLALVEEGNFPVHARIDYRPVAHLKDKASSCHISQLDGGSLRSGSMRLARYIFGSHDLFMRAYPPASADTRENDLLAGLPL